MTAATEMKVVLQKHLYKHEDLIQKERTHYGSTLHMLNSSLVAVPCRQTAHRGHG